MYTHLVDRSSFRAEQLLTLSGAARRLADIIASAEGPVQYEVLRHLLRVSEETMTEVLEESVHAGLVRRGDDPFTYVPHDEATGAELAASIDETRRARLRQQIRSASERVFE